MNFCSIFGHKLRTEHGEVDILVPMKCQRKDCGHIEPAATYPRPKFPTKPKGAK